MIETTGLIEFAEIFEKMDLSLYDDIYISLGSKYNGMEIITYKMADKTIHKKSNAKWQMIPSFIRNKPKSLLICVDRFENALAKTENAYILCDYEEFNMIICDIDGTIQIFESIIDIIVKSAIKYNISPEKLIIVNYIRFIHPNHTESYIEENLSSALHKRLRLHNNSIYEKCLYEWFGYQPNLYNIIYRYNVPIIHVILGNIINVLQKNIGNNEICIHDIRNLRDSNIIRKFLQIFLENTFDITLLSDELLPLYLYL